MIVAKPEENSSKLLTEFNCLKNAYEALNRFENEFYNRFKEEISNKHSLLNWRKLVYYYLKFSDIQFSNSDYKIMGLDYISRGLITREEANDFLLIQDYKINEKKKNLIKALNKNVTHKLFSVITEINPKVDELVIVKELYKDLI